MVRRIGRPLSLLAAAMLLLPGCGFIKEHQKAAIGAGIGAVAGAGIGYAIKGKKGALVGGVLGALAGGAIGEYLHRREKSAEETNRAHSYQPTQGVRLELVGAGANPATVAPGGEVELQATYALMAPNTQQEFEVTEVRLVTLNGTKVAEPTITVGRLPGTYTSTVPLKLPPDAPKGTYQVVVTVGTAGQSSQLSSTFTVN